MIPAQEIRSKRKLEIREPKSPVASLLHATRRPWMQKGRATGAKIKARGEIEMADRWTGGRGGARKVQIASAECNNSGAGEKSVEIGPVGQLEVTNPPPTYYFENDP